MRFQIISEIHLEFGLREFDFSKSDLLILAGDIHSGQKGLYFKFHAFVTHFAGIIPVFIWIDKVLIINPKDGENR